MESREIKIVNVNKEAIKTSPDKKDFWIVPFKLSQEPDQSWERIFSEAQKKDKDAMKRKTQVVGGCLEVEISETDDLQKVLDVLKGKVAEVNVQCEEDYQKKLRIRQELEEMRQREIKATQKLRDVSDKLEF